MRRETKAANQNHSSPFFLRQASQHTTMALTSTWIRRFTVPITTRELPLLFWHKEKETITLSDHLATEQLQTVKKHKEDDSQRMM